MIIWLLVGYMALLLLQPGEAMYLLGEFHAFTALLVALLIFWGFGLINGTKRFNGNVVVLGVFFYTLAIVLSNTASPYVGFSGSWAYRMWIANVVIFTIIVTSVKTERDLKIIVTCFILVIFYILAQTYWLFLEDVTTRRIGGVERVLAGAAAFSNPNWFGTFIIATLPLAVTSLLALCKKPWHYLFVLGHVILAVRIATLTGSRTAFVSFIALALFLTLFSRYRLLLFPVVFIGGAVVWTAVPEDAQQRYLTVVSDESRGHIREGTTLQNRLAYTTQGLQIWQRYPVFGAGPDQNGHVGNYWHYVHNLYGQIPADLGTVGIIAFLFLLSCFGINHYNIWKNYKYLQEKKLGDEGRYCWYVSIGIMFGIFVQLVQGLGIYNAYLYTWLWFGAFQAMAAVIMQEKVVDAMQGKLVPKMRV